MNKCASCLFLDFDVVRGDFCSRTKRSVNNSQSSGYYCKNYKMREETEEESIATNDSNRKFVIEKNK